MTFAIEYKLKEPRTRLLWSIAAATLVNIRTPASTTSAW
jgi:hypothetical protein